MAVAELLIRSGADIRAKDEVTTALIPLYPTSVYDLIM